MNWEISRFEDGRYFEFIHREGKLKDSVASFHVQPGNSGSQVTVHAKIVAPFFMRIIMLFMRGMMIKGMQADLHKLKELMEKQDI